MALAGRSTRIPTPLQPRSSLHVREGVGLHDREGVGHPGFELLIINNVNINNREIQDKHKHKE